MVGQTKRNIFDMKLKKRNKSVAVSEIKMVSNNESLNEKKKLILEIITFEV